MRKWKDLEKSGIGKKRWSDDGREWVRERERKNEREREREREGGRERERRKVEER